MSVEEKEKRKSDVSHPTHLIVFQHGFLGSLGVFDALIADLQQSDKEGRFYCHVAGMLIIKYIVF